MVAENQRQLCIRVCGQIVLDKVKLICIQSGMVAEVIPWPDTERGTVIARRANTEKQIISVIKIFCPGVLGRIVCFSLNRISLII